MQPDWVFYLAASASTLVNWTANIMPIATANLVQRTTGFAPLNLTTA